ncbi:flagellar basal body rod protein FlgC [Chromobacterium vaccinii]|uniref:flagellar basal body rod protein FlgC n=1 Tax=Chromobacterium vaccinii TaxID=1108595 RepID=UPI001E3BAC2E|nr:flagellar basal body rod protein FlgC [Chromobacterium vaccinii]MCD4501041.1 flagellar basal body rod protein FlgC [Chromobacterium vaccinii]
MPVIWQSLAISQSGMDVEQLRAEVAARNIANANVAAAPGAALAKPLRVVVQPVGAGFGQALSRAESDQPPPGGVRAAVVESDAPARKVLDPSSPLADAQGYVQYAGVNTLEEMFAMTMAVRSYEANVTAFNAARSMMQKALDIGGKQ